MKKFAVLLALLVLSTSAWAADTVGTCVYTTCGNTYGNQCGNPCGNPCWNPCITVPGLDTDTYKYDWTRESTKCVCGPVAGVTSWQNIGGFQISGCMGSFGTFGGCGGSFTWGGCGQNQPVPTN
jgi:hypothetical protein